MTTKNIFAGVGVRTTFVNILYDELMKRELLLDTNREAESGEGHIRSSLEQNLTNIDLLPMFNRVIMDRQVLRFSYQPFGQELFSLTFHPQFLKEYNGRWFVLGEANREPYHAYNVPFDRIVGDVNTVEGIEYIPAAGTISDNLSDNSGECFNAYIQHLLGQ